MSNSTIYTYGQPQGTQTNYCDYDVGPTHRNCIHYLGDESGPELVMGPKVKRFKGNEKVFSNKEAKKIIKESINKYKEGQK